MNVTTIINGEEYITRKQIAEQLPIGFYDSQRWLEKWRKNIEHLTIGKTIYYKKADLVKLMNVEC